MKGEIREGMEGNIGRHKKSFCFGSGMLRGGRERDKKGRLRLGS